MVGGRTELQRMRTTNRQTNKKVKPLLTAAAGTVALMSGLAGRVQAGTNGTWADTTTGGLWSVPGNWSSTVADGQDGTADFSTLTLGADNTVHLDTARTIGNLIFADQGGLHNWILDNNGTAGNTLTLSTSSGTPTITVNNDVATISAVLLGTQGLTKTGGASGTLILSGSNSYSGVTTLSAGTLLLGNAAGAGTSTINLSGGTFGASGAQAISNAVVATASTTTTLQGTAALTLNGALSGSGMLNIGSTGINLGNVSVNATNSPGNNSFSGALSVGGAMNFNSPGSVNGASYWYNLSNAAVTYTSGGTTQWNSANGTSGTAYLNFGSLSSTSGLGAMNGAAGGTNNTKGVVYTVGTLNTSTTYTGTINNSTNQLGTAFVKVGTGTLILTGADTYTGGTFIKGGTLQVGNGTTGSLSASTAVTFQDTGTFNYQGVTTGSTQTFTTALTFSGGAGTVQSTYGGTSGNTILTFGSMAARGTGATENYVVSGGANGSTNKIVFTTGPTAGALIDKGAFFGGSNYAAYDSTGYMRGLNYGTDTNTATVTGGTSTITSSSTSNVQLTGNDTSQATATSVNTLNMQGNSLSLAGTFLTNGILESGNASDTISGGTSLTTTASGNELVIRVDGSSDGLTISTPIIASGTNALTKTGAGTLTLSATGNTNSGTTYVDQGTLAISGTNTTGNGAYIVNGTGTLTIGGTVTTTGNFTVGNTSGNGILNVNGPVTANSNNTVGLIISNSTNGANTGSGVVNVNNGGTFSTNGDITVGLGGDQTGTLNIASGATINEGVGVLRWFKVGQFDNSNGVVNMAGGTLNLDFSSDIRFAVNGSGGNSAFNQNGGNVTVWSGSGTGTSGSAADGSVDMNAASGTGSYTYNLNGGTLTVNQVKSSTTTGTRAFNFNGGTLKAFSASAATFFNLGTGSARANVRNNGGIIDNNNFSVNIAQPLLHSNIAGDNATDGGMIFQGAATTTLSASNTYNGPTSINAGTLSLTGGLSNTAINNSATFTESVAGVISGGASLTNTAGTTTLAGANTYTGTTTVNAGTLRLTGSIGNSAVTVNPGGTLSGNGTIGGLVTLTSGNSAINLQDAAIGTLTLNGGLSLNNGNQLSYDVGSSTDLVSLSGGFSASGTTSINVTNLSGFGVNTYTLLSGTGLSNASPGTSVGPFSLNTTSLSGFALSLQLSGGNLQLLVNQVAPSTAYWFGSHDANWGTGSVSGVTNWVTGPHVTTDTAAIPAGVTDVHFAADSATHLATTLDQPFAINTLTFDNGVGAVSIGGSQNLTIASGITQASGAGPATINTSGQVILGNDQTWTNNSASTLTISSTISGAHALITAGTGVIQLGGSNSYANGTTISSGTLQVTNANALGTGSVTVNANLDLNGQALTTGALSGNTSGVIANTNASPASITSTVATGTSTYAGTIQNGSGGAVTLAKAGTGTLVLSGTNAYTGGTNISAGTLTVGTGSTNGTLGSGAISDGGTLNINHSDTVTIADPISGMGALQQSGTGTLVLSGSNNYSGTTTISAGTLEYQAVSAMSTTSALTIGSGTTLSLRADADTTFTPASLAMTTGGTNNFLVNSLNSPAGDNHSLTIANNAALGNGATIINVTSTTGDTLKFGSSFGTSANNSTAWGGPETTFNLTNANVVLNGMNATDGGMSVNSTTGNTLTINGTVSSSTNRTIYAHVNSGTLTLNNTVAGVAGTNNGFFVTLNGGTLNIQNAAAINTNANSGNNGGAGLTIAGGTLNNTNGAALTLSTNPTIRFNGDFAFSTAGGTSANNLNLGTGAVSLGTTAGSTRTITANGTSTLTIGGIISNGTTANSLTEAGTGTIKLSNANAYTGTTTVNGGTLLITNTTGSGTGSGSVTVSSPGLLGGTGIITGPVTVNTGTIFAGTTNNTVGKTAATLTIGSGSSLLGSTLLDLTAANTSDEIVFSNGAANTATLGGTLTVTNPNSITFASGQSYDLFSFNSNIESGTFSNLPAGLPALSAGLAWNTSSLYTSGIISIGTSGPANLFFTGSTGNGNWDIASTTNFTDGSTALVFHTGDNVTFDDTTGAGGHNTGQFTVIIASGGVVPGSMTVTGNTPYTFTGGNIGSASSTSLTVASGASMTVDRMTGSRITVELGALNNSGTINLKDNRLIIHNVDQPTADATTAAIFTQLQNGFAGGTWAGTGGTSPSILSSSAAGSSLYTLGEVESGTDVNVYYAYYGDANLDGTVDGTDYSLIDTGFGSGGTMTGWQNGDFNYDGHIDGSDYSLIDNAFNTQTGSVPAAQIAMNTSEIAGGSAAVPEPASLGLLGVGALGLLARRRRRA
jgi:fibronectin-binding autotransporter adhesin